MSAAWEEGTLQGGEEGLGGERLVWRSGVGPLPSDLLSRAQVSLRGQRADVLMPKFTLSQTLPDVGRLWHLAREPYTSQLMLSRLWSTGGCEPGGRAMHPQLQQSQLYPPHGRPVSCSCAHCCHVRVGAGAVRAIAALNQVPHWLRVCVAIATGIIIDGLQTMLHIPQAMYYLGP